MATQKAKQVKKAQTEKPKNSNGPRRLKLPKYKSFKLAKKPIKIPTRKIIGAPRLFYRSSRFLGNHWKLFGGILLIYTALSIIMVGGLGGGSDLETLKTALKEPLLGNLNGFATGLTLFAYLVTSGGHSVSSVAGAYQTILVLLISLIIIWALRQTHSSVKIRIRDAFYNGVYPLVPFILVLVVVGLQLLPAIIGVALYSLVVGGGIAVLLIEKMICFLVMFLLIVLSLYMICSSLFALYIVTLPNMTPMKALRSARQLVVYRRWIVLRKILFLPLVLLVVMAIIMVPAALFITPAAAAIFSVLSFAALFVLHSYMYSLYRELIT